MKKRLYLCWFLLLSFSGFAQTGWKICNSPAFNGRVDDIYMLNTQTGYAVCGDGSIVKTMDGGENWFLLEQSTGIYYRSVEFINTQKGFVGGFPVSGGTTNILRRTDDGGTTWTDLTPLLHQKARRGICGLAAPDANTIYGGGNWYHDSSYIVKSTDGGNSWSYIDMTAYATSIIDLNFISKDTGFATGKGPLPAESGIILYTTNGGASWTTKFLNTIPNEYCWKIQRLTPRLWFASLEDFGNVPPKVLRSVDGGMTWIIQQVSTVPYNIEGIGFIDPMRGWTGGDVSKSFETKDGGKTWQAINVCPFMNRVFKVNDTMLLASGNRIWKYKGTGIYPAIPAQRFAWLNCYPNPVRDILTMEVSVAMPTRVLVMLVDASGKRVKTIDNADREKGSYQFYLNTSDLPMGIYFVVLKTHEDKRTVKIIVSR